MQRRESLKESAGWVELPTGIFTADGIWFHTTESALREFAGEVVERVGMGPLLMSAGAWLHSADTVCAIALLILLLLIPPISAAVLALVLYVLWQANASGLLFIPLVRLVSFFSGAAVQGVLYVVVVSWLGMDHQITAVIVGLVGFILLRWGLVRKGIDGLLGLIRNGMQTDDGQKGSAIPMQDRVLRALVVRHALAMGITLPSLEAYEQRILEIWNRGNRAV